MPTTKQELLKNASNKTAALLRLTQARFNKLVHDGNRAAVFLKKHPKFTSWLMKKSPKAALYITIILTVFGNKQNNINYARDRMTNER